MSRQVNSEKRCLTGIPGLEEILVGGLPQGKSMVLIGGPGSGKTIFLSQFIHNGIKEYDEPGVFITLHESPESIKENMLKLGWNLSELESKKQLKFLDLSPIVFLSPEEFHRTVYGLKVPEFTIESMVTSIKRQVDSIHAKRIAIDGITSLSIYEDEPNKNRRTISHLFQGLLRTSCTCLFTSEVRASTLEREFQIEEYLADGVILLQKIVKRNKLTRTIQIDKMRGISHDSQPHPYDIKDNGIIVFPNEVAL